jgi:subtilisin family serine protease
MAKRLGIALLVVALTGPVGLPASAAARSSPDKLDNTVTLVTGDKVRVFGQAGAVPRFAVEPGPGREHVGFVGESAKGGDTSVIPVDAVPLLASGRLDPRLFNVSELVRQGRTGAPPLIISHGQAKAAPVTFTRSLPSIDAEAVETRQPGEFWHWLTTSKPAKVWLDGLAKPKLDVSVPQIGGPVAWQMGLTGAGVTVGVLDSGIKGDHPDLAGKIVEAKDFTGTDTGDEVGHGTHVAGIISGTGAASNGRYRGVAPDAKLVNGKVCVQFGCPESAVIAGMEWIAPRTKIVNMSLGGESTDGTDPMSQALNTLSARYGTLFVVAGSNDRSIYDPDPLNSVSAPAVADAALAVGSVSKQDTTSFFSGPGPRLGDYAVKPDIAAPGEDIVSARAAGTPAGDEFPVDANYAMLSGTSMSAPHVAGAAAILLQQHPGWTAADLKPALTSTAKPTAGVFEQGAGRVDVGRAVTQRVRTTGASVNFGFLSWPRTSPVARTVTYRNDGDAPVTLKLAVDTPFTAPNQATVPAHGTADVNVSVGSATGLRGGRLTATADGVAVQTALAAFVEPESYDVTINLVSRVGEQGTSIAQAVDTETGRLYGIHGGKVRLPRGRYDINVIDVSATSATLLSKPSLNLNADTTVPLDANAAKPARALVDRPNARLQAGELGVYSATRSGDHGVSLSYVAGPGKNLYALPTGQVGDHTYAYDFRATMGPVAPDQGAGDFVYQLAFLERGRIPADPTYRVRNRDLATVDATYHGQGAPAISVRADYATFPIPAGTGLYPVTYQYPLPVKRTEYYTANPDVAWQHLFGETTPELTDAEVHVSRRTYTPGTYTAGWARAPLGPAFGESQDGFGVLRSGTTMQVVLSVLSGNDPHQVTVPPVGLTGTTTLTRDGTPVGTFPAPGFAVFQVPDGPGAYTMHVTADREVPWSVVGTHAEVDWTFKDTAPSGTPLPLLVVRAVGPVDGQSRAPAGQLFPLVLVAQHQPGLPAVRLDTLRVDASYDDGLTWTSAPTISARDTGVALLRHPKAPGFVSLRVTARDKDGSSVSQTILRAYQTT